MNERYNVILEGRARPEADREAVIPDLAALVGRDAAFARELLGGRPVVLRSNVAQAEAEEALASLQRIGVLARLEHAPDLQIDADVETRLHARPRPRLWNPNAAACWSLIFTPVFGALLHLWNWQAMGRVDRVAGARAWLAASATVFVVTLVVSLVMPGSGNALRAVNFLYLLLWYFVSARPQVKAVATDYRGDYVRRGWWRPLLVAIVVAIGSMIISGFFEGVVVRDSTTGSGATRL